MKTRIALALLASACAQPPTDVQGLAHSVPQGPNTIMVADDGAAQPVDIQALAAPAPTAPTAVDPPPPPPACVQGDWTYTFTFGPGTCDSDPFVSAIEALDDPPAFYPSQCFVLPVNAPNLFSSAGAFVIDDNGFYGQPVTVNGCDFAIDYLLGPMRDACGEDRTVVWDFSFTATPGGAIGSGTIYLDVAKEDTTVGGVMVPYASCEQQVTINATKL
jgi:hypothetical protein